jgi:hypothetical protein
MAYVASSSFFTPGFRDDHHDFLSVDSPWAERWTCQNPLTISGDSSSGESTPSLSNSPSSPSYSISTSPNDTAFINYYYSPPQGPIGLGIDFSDTTDHKFEPLGRCLPMFVSIDDSSMNSIMTSHPLVESSFCDPKALALPGDVEHQFVEVEPPVDVTMKSHQMVLSMDGEKVSSDRPKTRGRKPRLGRRKRTKPELKLDLSVIETNIYLTETGQATGNKRRKIVSPTGGTPAAMDSDATVLEESSEPEPVEVERLGESESVERGSDPSSPETLVNVSESEDQDYNNNSSNQRPTGGENSASSIVTSTSTTSITTNTASTISSPASDAVSPCDEQVTPVNYRRGRKPNFAEDKEKTFVCDHCQRRFRRQEHLKRHFRSLHTREKPFKCDECGKKFSRSDNLSQHARTHSKKDRDHSQTLDDVAESDDMSEEETDLSLKRRRK